MSSPCEQKQTIKKIEKDVAENKQQYLLQQKEMSMNLKSLENSIEMVSNKVDKINNKLENRYYTKEEAHADIILQKEQMKNMREKVDKHQTLIDKTGWAMWIGLIVFIATSSLLVYSYLGK